MTDRGTTLPELLVVVVLLGMLALLGGLAVTGLRDRAAVALEQHRVVQAIHAARGAAVRLGVPVRLLLGDSAHRVTTRTIAGDSIVAWRSPGTAGHGVRLAGASGALLFAPGGIAMGASNRTLTLTRGGVTRKVIVSRLGRVTVQ